MGNSPSLSPTSGKKNSDQQRVALNYNKRYGGFRKKRPDSGDRESPTTVVLVQSQQSPSRCLSLDDDGRPLDYVGRDGNRSAMVPDSAYYDSTTGNCHRHPGDEKDCDPSQLIVARKPPNPNKQNPDLRELQRELAFNNKMGINVLGQKTELQKAMEKMRRQVFTKQLDEEKKSNRSDLEVQLEKRAMRLREYENDMTDHHHQPVDGGGFPVSENEFHRIHAKDVVKKVAEGGSTVEESQDGALEFSSRL